MQKQKLSFKFLLASLGALACLVTQAAFAAPAQAGTDLTVTCSVIGVCAISPAATPLYNEAGWIPGSAVTQRLSITNAFTQDGFAAIQMTNYVQTKALGSVIDIFIHVGSPVGPVVYSASSLDVFHNDGYFTLGSLPAGQTNDYYFVATMDPAAGNEFQASMVKFDLNAGLELAPIPPPSGGNTGGGGGGSVAGATTQAQPPGCGDQAPTSAPVVTVTNVGNNTVTLSWTPVSPVTTYGLFFTGPGGAQYGAPSIGNVTTYTITNLTGGGANYQFQVFGINGCMPGPRSNTATQVVRGGAVFGRPLGPGGAVLGVTTASSSAEVSPSPSPTDPNAQGQVEGATDTAGTCASWRTYIPWILLVLQFLFVLLAEYRYRTDNGWTKHFLALGITLASIALFYWLRECPCYGQWSWLAWLCTWYWIVAAALTLIVKGFSYAFLDETTDREVPPKTALPPKPTT